MKFNALYLILIFVAILGSLFFYTLIDVFYLETAQEDSCKKMDMDYYEAQDSIFCVEDNGNAHYVKIECDDVGFWEWNCYPRIISIGDIRVK